MTREAKIGMLTGLGVIVLVGVLLSEYLGGATPSGSGTGQMAALPLGDSYRQEIMQPVGVPGMVRGDATTSGGTTDSPAPAQAYAAVDTSNAGGSQPLAGPVLGQPVTPIPAGPVVMDSRAGDSSVPTVDMGHDTSVQNALYVAGNPATDNGQKGTIIFQGGAQPPVADAPKGDIYVIAAGDNLAKIAKKYYHSSKDSDVRRIVVANPTVLKDENAMLVVGKKLLIPYLSQTAKAPSASVAKASDVKKADPVVIHPPIAKASTDPKAAPKKDTTVVYVVQSGDSLEKIARKISPNAVSATVKKILALNGLKDADSLKAGDKLKIPAK